MGNETGGSRGESGTRVQITILVNNQVGSFFHYPARYPFVWFRKVHASHLVAEHGLSFLVEVFSSGGGRAFTLLFDVGSINMTILHNLPRFLAEWGTVDEVVLSHGHYDHAGALYEVLDRVPHPVDVHAHPDALCDRYFKRDPNVDVEDLWGKSPAELAPLVESEAIAYFPGVSRERALESGGRFVATREPREVFEGGGVRILSTGEVPRVHPEERPPSFTRVVDGIAAPDDVMDDQALVVDLGGERTILLLGCCHSGLMNTLDLARRLAPGPVTHVIGGTHMVGAPPRRTEATLEYLKGMPGKKFLFPVHCTGPDFLNQVRGLGDDALIGFDASVGTQFSFDA
ncbi:MAG: MBL fold metallo-hydrolase [Promethearchaeota archaeon]